MTEDYTNLEIIHLMHIQYISSFKYNKKVGSATFWEYQRKINYKQMLKYNVSLLLMINVSGYIDEQNLKEMK